MPHLHVPLSHIARLQSGQQKAYPSIRSSFHNGAFQWFPLPDPLKGFPSSLLPVCPNLFHQFLINHLSYSLSSHSIAIAWPASATHFPRPSFIGHSPHLKLWHGCMICFSSSSSVKLLIQSPLVISHPFQAPAVEKQLCAPFCFDVLYTHSII